jgi:hypothetical protein
MSILLLPPVAAIPGTVEAAVMHLVSAGKTACEVCGVSKFRMRFHYTDSPDLYTMYSTEAVSEDEAFAMYHPSERMMLPYTTCRRFDGNSH